MYIKEVVNMSYAKLIKVFCVITAVLTVTACGKVDNNRV
ncbi:MAG: hypothetical protein K0S61_4580, partial [Anaerocolumna sp.]|nr:hypothetical protein [Anaerocolumna sp.]